MPQLIAYVENNPQTAALIGDILQSEGYLPYAVFPCTHAVGALQALLPAAIILDLHLTRFPGGGEGWQMLDEIRADPQLAETPVLVCSADTWAMEDRHAVLRDYGCHVLAKPFQVHDFLSELQAALTDGPHEGGSWGMTPAHTGLAAAYL